MSFCIGCDDLLYNPKIRVAGNWDNHREVPNEEVRNDYPKRTRETATSPRFVGHAIDFHPHLGVGELGLDGCTRRPVCPEKLRINFVHPRELAAVPQEHRAL